MMNLPEFPPLLDVVVDQHGPCEWKTHEVEEDLLNQHMQFSHSFARGW